MQNIIHSNLEKDINSWFKTKFNGLTLPFYSSIDLRNSGCKIAPVDANLFPAGFNNLSEISRVTAAKLIKSYFETKQYKKALIIPENYTRNKMYIENVFAIEKILQLADFETKIGLFHSEAYNLIELYETIVEENSLLKTTSGFVPDVVILNRDMTSHIPDILKNVKQEIIPSPLYGWHSRQKFQYFKIYQELASEFCSEFQIDLWLISAFTENCNEVDFNDDSSLKAIAVKVDQILSLVQKKYQEHKIKTQPYVFIKASNGTYGMGIITVTSGEEVLNLNKKKRHKMKKVKEGIEVSSVIIQEGVPTIDVFKRSPAEPLIYYIGNIPMCYLYRCNSRKDIYSSLNSTDCEFYDISQENKTLPLWNIVSKLAVLALAVEIRSFHL
ncbi:glutamate--cysteine ligase-related protein [Wolbachia endosymbiont of Armadillidium vulgare str. wVulC]|uniref:Glutamate--cysteine ligase n=1 Tax=Wolbachia endosymbiont of Armadillidium arcangelii TaxID=3158571 RepID=A0AAU7Q1L2_9RICK|nr:glutamate--cysteine ligase [Wolbachia endosymbiont of Armadillidium vulgare]KLT22039.1 glutamate--cysteine ligase-related protein [Wolbachia endosymbiont of Armadillidium vulgare str. wVulC]OJH33093.1 Glutamate-cysteine ligase [Wolbachia endosymbiont of Armadillidium vulgare]